jgi:hypothetical protein
MLRFTCNINTHIIYMRLSFVNCKSFWQSAPWVLHWWGPKVRNGTVCSYIYIYIYACRGWWMMWWDDVLLDTKPFDILSLWMKTTEFRFRPCFFYWFRPEPEVLKIGVPAGTEFRCTPSNKDLLSRCTYLITRKYMHAETLALLTKPLYFPNMKYLEQLSW